MAKGSNYCVPFRRRREGKTDYRKRKALIISGKPRLVVRPSLKNVTVQVIVAEPEGDKVLVSAHSKELEDFGWKAPKGNIPAAYLTGLLCGLRAKSENVDEANLDIGLHSPSKGARVFAALKGFLDAKVEAPHSEEKLPDEKRISGEHIAEYAKILASNPENYQSRFSHYLRNEVQPENIVKHFAQVKASILAAFKGGGKKK
ncbi:MAG: 50S ribosomal protein L18 [Candidatus Bathyarchaeia archaeon]